MTEINRSTIATGGSTIQIKNITIEKKKSFIKGFFVGVLSSMTASGIIYFLKRYWIYLLS